MTWIPEYREYCESLVPVVEIVADLVKRGITPLSMEVDRGHRWDRIESEEVSPLSLAEFLVLVLLGRCSSETSLEVKS
jgi:hypothetical protein